MLDEMIRYGKREANVWDLVSGLLGVFLLGMWVGVLTMEFLLQHKFDWVNVVTLLIVSAVIWRYSVWPVIRKMQQLRPNPFKRDSHDA